MASLDSEFVAQMIVMDRIMRENDEFFASSLNRDLFPSRLSLGQ